MDLSLNISGLKVMLRFSSRKLLLNRRWVIVALVAALVAVVMGYVASQTQAGIMDEGSSLMSTLVLTFLLPVMALIYGASMIRNEMDDRSITHVITSPVDRRVSYLGYYLSLIGVLSVMLLIIGFVGWSAFFLTEGAGADAFSLLLSYSLLLIIGSMVYCSLFLALGVILKQPIYFGLLYAFVWEGLIGSVPGAIGHYTVMYNLKVIGAELIHYGSIVDFSGDAAVAVLSLGVFTAIMLALGALVFWQKEVP